MPRKLRELEEAGVAVVAELVVLTRPVEEAVVAGVVEGAGVLVM